MKRNVRNTKYDSKQQLQHSNDYLLFIFAKTKTKNLIVYEKQQNLTKVSSGSGDHLLEIHLLEKK
jgi:hypothetical protein